MKIVTYLLGALLAAALGAAAVFYVTTFQPMTLKMKADMSELDKAKGDLKKYTEKERKEYGWINQIVESFNASLSDEIKAGKAEVVSTGNAVVVNIAEEILYTPASKTFSKNGNQTLVKLDFLLKNEGLKDKNIYIGNMSEAVPSRGKGKKAVPGKDALMLSSERSYELAKHLEKNGVPGESLGALAYFEKTADNGFKIKNKKTMIIIGRFPAVPVPLPLTKEATAPTPEVKPASSQTPTDSPAAQQEPKNN